MKEISKTNKVNHDFEAEIQQSKIHKQRYNTDVNHYTKKKDSSSSDN